MASIFILSGQSNMDGCATTADLPDSLRSTPPNVRLFQKGDFRPLCDEPRFGPEVGLGHSLAAARPNDTIVLCKVSQSGANLYYDWNPDAGSGGPEDQYRGPMYPQLLDALPDLGERLRTEGEEPTVRAMFWMQGERDSVFEHMAMAYERNLAAFIERVRGDIASDLPFVVAQIAPRVIDEIETGRYRHAWREQVRAAQSAVAEALHYVALVPTDDLPQFDNLHYDAAGQILLGRRFAQAYLDLCPD